MNGIALSASSVLALLATIMTPAPRLVAEVTSPIGGDCTGCEAHAADGGGFTDGVQIIYQGHITLFAALGVEPGECDWIGDKCVPTKNCKFTAYCLALMSVPFHDDLAPCNWSSSTPLGEALYTQQEFIWGCDKTAWFWSVRYFSSATNCQDGSLTGEVKLSGYCDRCSPDSAGQ